MKLFTSALLITSCFALPFASFAQDGSLDNTFDSDGRVTTAFGLYNDGANAVAIQSDGKIVTAGYSSSGPDLDFSAARYNTDGSLDITFDGDGKLTTQVGSSHDRATSIAIQLDGKIIVAGYSDSGPYIDFAILRYNTDGSLDNTFDTDGIVLVGFSGADAYSYSVKIQTDGKIVVAGYASSATGIDFALVRLNTNGSLDNLFDIDGKLTSDIITNSSDYCTSVAIQTDGKIVASGYVNYSAGIEFATIRYNTDGSLDNTFDTDGIVTTAFTSAINFSTSVAIQTDGKILVAGETSNGVDRDNALVRYNTNGSLDVTFDTDGKVTNNFGSSDNGALSIAIQSDGKILATGYSSNGSFDDASLVRYNSNGSLDNTFDTDGIVTYSIAGSYLAGNSIALQTDGKIVVAGSDGADYLVLRFNNVIPLGINMNLEQSTETSIYPNPFSTQTVLQSEYIFNSATLVVYDTYGQVVKEIKNINGQTVTISRDNLSCGVYFIRLIENNTTLSLNKLVITD